MHAMGEASVSPVWEPSAELREHATVTRFARWAGERYDRQLSSYDELWRWSTDELEEFWAAVWEFCGVRSSRPYERVLASQAMPGAVWFPGAALNYAENMLAGGDPDAVAVLHASELRELGELTRGDLRAQVASVAAGLGSLGVARGDRVVAYMPNTPETLVAFLAVSSLGAVWSSAAPEFGARSVLDRFAQIEPKVLMAIDGYRYGGRDFDRRDTVAGLLDGLPTVERTVLVPYLHDRPDPGNLRGGLVWDDLLAAGAGAELAFAQVRFDHPLWVLYSSGTTGLPKAIVHGHGGILLELLKVGHLQLDLRRGDRMFWFTTTGWMMWNLLVSCLATEAALVLYDGSPAHPSLDVLWRLAERTRMTHFGTSAGFIASCLKEGVEPGRDHDLSALRAIGSTASPLSPEGFSWVYEHVKRDVQLASTSGGTDVCSSFVGGSPVLPVYRGELQCRLLGCAVEAWDEHGRPLVDEVGELVVTRPMPSMPLCFWGDPGGRRYRESYFETYPGVWRHGDWIRITPRGGAVIYGRSDATINRQGVRIGTSELYNAATSVEEVVDALAVDVPRDGELWLPLFVVLRAGLSLDDALAAAIKRRIREDCSPRHVPDEIIQIPEVPRTLSGKALEVPVKRILSGTPPEEAVSVESLANPHALDVFVELYLSAQGGNPPSGLPPRKDP
jgi:acetoacetyl-CoA synthetase